MEAEENQHNGTQLEYISNIYMDGQLTAHILFTVRWRTTHGTQTIIKSSSRRLGTAFARQ